MAKQQPDTVYSQEVADKICKRIACGESLRVICEDVDMPHRSSVYDWMDQNKEFAAKYATARARQADAMDDEILETARECTPESANADKVKIDAMKWRAARLNPKQYGDRTDLVVSGEISITAAIEGARARISRYSPQEDNLIDITPERTE